MAVYKGYEFEVKLDEETGQWDFVVELEGGQVFDSSFPENRELLLEGVETDPDAGETDAQINSMGAMAALARALIDGLVAGDDLTGDDVIVA